MNDLIDSTAFQIATKGNNPWKTAIAVLKAVSATLRNIDSDSAESAFLITSDWIEAQINLYQTNSNNPCLPSKPPIQPQQQIEYPLISPTT